MGKFSTLHEFPVNFYGQGHAWCECLSLEGVYRTDDGGEMNSLWLCGFVLCFWCPAI